ncbi:MAG: hypothetical protein CMH30_05980 [Micavibrio sp.]|nr:hypothetical protein [Micavibrio sp.]|tara:strand:- start:5842 stop:6792 length:951 start_codon:yes stop_codon:yes gene_type:complete
MSQKYKVATVFGGTGFLGRHIIKQLADQGIRVRVATRHPKKAYFLKPYGTVGQISAEFCNGRDIQNVEKLVKGSDYVINLVGLLYEKGKNTFERAHIDLPQNIALAAAKFNVKSFIHISALGIDENKSKYAKTKKKGEEVILDLFPKVTILRPSLVFGPEDNFFNQFAALSKCLPALPLIGGGHTEFQPIYVGDVAKAVINCIDNPKTSGKIYELAGAEIFTFKQLLQKTLSYTGRDTALIPLPFFLARIEAVFLSLLPKPLLTQDQITSLHYHNIATGHHQTLEALNITPTLLDIVLPSYLSRFKQGGHFAHKVA